MPFVGEIFYTLTEAKVLIERWRVCWTSDYCADGSRSIQGVRQRRSSKVPPSMARDSHSIGVFDQKTREARVDAQTWRQEASRVVGVPRLRVSATRSVGVACRPGSQLGA